LNVNLKKIIITTFFMSKDEYEKVSDINKAIVQNYMESLKAIHA
jgi:hypothetical protein